MLEGTFSNVRGTLGYINYMTLFRQIYDLQSNITSAQVEFDDNCQKLNLEFKPQQDNPRIGDIDLDNKPFRNYQGFNKFTEFMLNSFQGNNHVYKVAATFEPSNIKLVFESEKGFVQDQETRIGSIDLLCDS